MLERFQVKACRRDPSKQTKMRQKEERWSFHLLTITFHWFACEKSGMTDAWALTNVLAFCRKARAEKATIDWESLIISCGWGMRPPWAVWLRFLQMSFKKEMILLSKISSSLLEKRSCLSQLNRSLRDKWDGGHMEKQPNQAALTKWQEKKMWWIESASEQPKWHKELTCKWCACKTSEDGIALLKSFHRKRSCFWGKEMDHKNFQKGSKAGWF